MNIKEAKNCAIMACIATIKRKYLLKIESDEIKTTLKTENGREFNFEITYSVNSTSFTMISQVNRNNGLASNCVTSFCLNGKQSDSFCRNNSPQEIQPQGS